MPSRSPYTASRASPVRRAHPLLAAEHRTRFRMGGQVLHLQRHTVLGPQVVGVEEGGELAVRGGDGSVARRGRAAVLLLDDMHLGARRENLRRAIGRAVVADDDLERLVVLGQEAVECGLEERPSPLYTGMDRTDEGRGHERRAPAPSS